MDAVVDVLKARDDGQTGHFNTGRRIGLQLKASESEPSGRHAAVQILVRTLRYWLGSQDPFAIVFCHVPTRRLVYRWVDDDLVVDLGARDASWFTRESVTIHLPLERVLTSDRLEDFDREARQVVVRRHRVLTPGTYGRLSEEARSAMVTIVRVARKAGFESIVSQLASAEEQVRAATYVVALAGRMRAGKSTLFNALVRREVSPVARRPTTAVPLLASAGSVDQATVAFLDGTSRTLAATSEALAEYATQERNPDNQKKVRMVGVGLVSERLERGIAILDAPGLFDPSEEIRAITARALAQANAVLFVMDVSSARSGGFAVEFQVLDELKRVLDHSDRVFLLLNKADELDETDREDVRATLGAALDRYGLANRLAAPPTFVSARKAWEWVVSGMESESPIADLETEIWDYLLRTNSTGVMRLETALRNSAKAIDDALEFVGWRRATSEQAILLLERLGRARNEIADLRAECLSAKTRSRDAVVSQLEMTLAAVPSRMADEMRAVAAVPSRETISKQLDTHFASIFGGAWHLARAELEMHAMDVSQRLESALNQVRLDHEPIRSPTLMAPSFVLPQISLLAPEAIGFGAVGWFISAVAAPAYTLAAIVGSFLLGAWLGHDKQLAREIERVEGRIRDHIRDALVGPARELLTAVVSGHERLARHLEDRWSVFEKNVRDRLGEVGTPLSESDRARLDRLEADLVGVRRRLDFVAEELRWTPDPGGNTSGG